MSSNIGDTAGPNEVSFEIVLFIPLDVDICRRKIQFVQRDSAAGCRPRRGTRWVLMAIMRTCGLRRFNAPAVRLCLTRVFCVRSDSVCEHQLIKKPTNEHPCGSTGWSERKKVKKRLRRVTTKQTAVNVCIVSYFLIVRGSPRSARIKQEVSARLNQRSETKTTYTQHFTFKLIKLETDAFLMMHDTGSFFFCLNR